ncbi:MAG: hypothetical protein A3F13_02695 [Gammaproteobacteria bacterium RIFCSPHIGHO2_12_FULL_40_19]|nr:MAG: hypothetical protein A3F13_02695 [Gammaproteobacteria bacterium RIFCSPHIGHO2_12_FULL_40_19]
MDEEVLNSASPEVAPQETEQNHAEAQATEPVAQREVDSSQDRNWRQFRERQKELERELKRKDEILESVLKMQAANAPPKPIEVDELDSIGDDDYVPKGKSKRLVQKELDPLRKKIEELEAQLNHQKQNDQFTRLRRQYSDFDEVVNPETMALLEQQDPELAETIVELKDPYKIGIQTYKYVKAMNLQAKVPDSRRSKEIDQKLEKNTKTVQSPLANEKRPMAQAFKLTEGEKSKLQEEMMHYAAFASSVPELS